MFQNREDLIARIRYYLAHDSERQAIATAGYERTLKEHTWQQRWTEIFKRCGERKGRAV